MSLRSLRMFHKKQKHITRIVTAIFLVVAFFSSDLSTVLAQSKKGFEALPVTSSGGGTLSLLPGESKIMTMSFQNIGSKTWKREGAAHVSLYTHGPKYRTSVFRDTSWVRDIQPVRLTEASVAPGEVGTITFTLHAPEAIGSFVETFSLAAEETAWIPGGQFTLKIEVRAAAIPSEPESVSALLLIRSVKEVTTGGGEPITYTIGVKNTGNTSWTKREIRVPDVMIASAQPNTRHASWVSTTQLVTNTSAPTPPGALEYFTFTFRAPNSLGTHMVRYVMAVDDKTVPDFFIDIPVTVTSTSPQIINDPVLPTSASAQDPLPYETSAFIEEPYLRVGVLIVDEETDWQIEASCDTQWELRGGDGALLGEMSAGESARAFYKNGKYWFNRGKGLESTAYWIRFVPVKEGAICTVQNFDRRITRRYRYPDNQFRNILEIRHNDHKDRTWLINELKMDDYLAGLAETSNSSHPEYQKALVTAARTFAYYHAIRNTKRAKEFFTISAYADDQVYNGYGHEMRSPTIAQAVRDTRGVVVTRKGEYALTPYFSRSDGRTRAWSEVWGGNVEWLKSVPTPCDERKGRKLWGHGVGMSATEALCMADESGKKWDEILKYFYTGVELTRLWE